ncbi:efflux RND transporter periplasmic adaptor subunit [Candidatus Nitrosacidococcus tergens]|uniref:Efflux transporter, RND family, MFP subunit n=1 Tax=Candidatus Nitrosacidococcus tergens TaxID=553981 RepID=A0A7G1QBZ6_9GAMM|nr:efflux RND transporter periplasmic adaptor subunit [Candidatus Nitrosacidococcus tergens]CAB1277019.1 Efflux transporter, RND family, MFP subunit [Candidatus Nitrosacidococcus tergens]
MESISSLSTVKINDTKSHSYLENSTDIDQLLAQEVQLEKQKCKKLWLSSILLFSIGIGWMVYKTYHPNTPLSFQTLPIQAGNLTIVVTATGTLQPVNQVDVGSELSGIVDSVSVDYNDQVTKGQVLAQVNIDRLKTQEMQAIASLNAAKASLKEAQATVLETKLRFQRCGQLAKRQLCSQEELDTDQAAYARAQAAEMSAKAQVAMAEATLSTEQTDIEKSTIRAPIDGIVLTRSVEPGQTVAASFETPVLFTLAENLSQMMLYVNVDEADIGQVQVGQKAHFTVDAYPDRQFLAQITQVRYGALEVDGVITYETLLKVENQDLALRPGMTATADIIVNEINHALLIPNKALRFVPIEKDKTTQPTPKRGLVGMLFPGPRPGPPKKYSDQTKRNKKSQQIWILKEGQPTPVSVVLGESDGIHTQILKGDFTAGMEVILDTVRKSQS